MKQPHHRLETEQIVSHRAVDCRKLKHARRLVTIRELRAKSRLLMSPACLWCSPPPDAG